MTPSDFRKNQNRIMEDLRTLILRHDQVINSIESRLDQLTGSTDDPEQILVRSQLEFVLLNVESAKLDKVVQLTSMEEMLSYQDRTGAPHPMIGPYPATGPTGFPVMPMPSHVDPDKIQSSLMYKRKDNPSIGCVVYRLDDGKLYSPLGTEWTDDINDWDLVTEQTGKHF